MPDSKLPSTPDPSFDDFEPKPDGYTILRKGSLYNIQGPYGREFSRNKSASVVGPRWEELTHTPWPYESSAYQSGLRLWELGVIRREHVGLRKLLVESAPDSASLGAPSTAKEDIPVEPHAEVASTPVEPDTAKESETEADSVSSNPYVPRVDSPKNLTKPVQPPLRPAKPTPRQSQPNKTLPSQREPKRDSKPRQQRLMFQENWDDYREPIKPKKSSKEAEDGTDSPVEPSIQPAIRLALPAPRIDLSEQNRRITALRRDPKALFEAGTRDALQQEVDYDLPHAEWAKRLLNLLDRFERRQRRRSVNPVENPATITAKHIAWQKEKIDSAAISH